MSILTRTFPAVMLLAFCSQGASAVTLSAVLDDVSYRVEPGGQGPFYYARFDASALTVLDGVWSDSGVNTFTLDLSAPIGSEFFMQIPDTGTVVRVGANLVIEPVGPVGGPGLGAFSASLPTYENFTSNGSNFTSSGSVLNGPNVAAFHGNVFASLLLNIAGGTNGAGLSFSGLELERDFGSWGQPGGLDVTGFEHLVYFEFFIQLSSDSPAPDNSWAGIRPIPLPAPVFLLASGLAALVGLRRGRRA